MLSRASSGRTKARRNLFSLDHAAIFLRCKHETSRGGIISTAQTLAGVQRGLCKVNQICSGAVVVGGEVGAVCDQFIFPVRPLSLYARPFL